MYWTGKCFAKALLLERRLNLWLNCGKVFAKDNLNKKFVSGLQSG